MENVEVAVGNEVEESSAETTHFYVQLIATNIYTNVTYLWKM